MAAEIPYKDLSYKIIGLYMEVHRTLGKGHNENVYKDALQYELQEAGISFTREKKFIINYKSIILPHQYFADFVIEDKIILEIKAIESLTDAHAKPNIELPGGIQAKARNFGQFWREQSDTPSGGTVTRQTPGTMGRGW